MSPPPPPSFVPALAVSLSAGCWPVAWRRLRRPALCTAMSSEVKGHRHVTLTVCSVLRDSQSSAWSRGPPAHLRGRRGTTCVYMFKCVVNKRCHAVLCIPAASGG